MKRPVRTKGAMRRRARSDRLKKVWILVVVSLTLAVIIGTVLYISRISMSSASSDSVPVGRMVFDPITKSDRSPSLLQTVKSSILAKVFLVGFALLIVALSVGIAVYFIMGQPEPLVDDLEEQNTEGEDGEWSWTTFVMMLVAVLLISGVIIVTKMTWSAGGLFGNALCKLNGHGKPEKNLTVGERFVKESRALQKPGELSKYYSFTTDPPPVLEKVPYIPGSPDDDPDLTRVRELGSGSFGKVYLYRRISNNTFLAVKEIDFTSSDVANNDELKQMLHNEAALLQKFSNLDSEHFIDFLGAYEEKDGNNETAKLYLLMEYLYGSDITGICQFQLFKDKIVVLVIIREVLKAVKVMHDHGWRHRDIKPENIFITQQGTVKLIDLGAAGPVGDTTVIGSPGFMSDEVMGQVDLADQHNFFAPMQFLLTPTQKLEILDYLRGYEPLDIYSVGRTMEAISDPSLVDIIAFSRQHMTQVNPCYRQTASSLLRHPIFKQCDGKKLAMAQDLSLTVVDD